MQILDSWINVMIKCRRADIILFAESLLSDYNTALSFRFRPNFVRSVTFLVILSLHFSSTAF
jgi:hypothetical protein